MLVQHCEHHRHIVGHEIDRVWKSMQQCSSDPFADPREVQRMLRDAIVEYVKLQHEFGTQSFAFGLVPER